jgi:hypothetical protein
LDFSDLQIAFFEDVSGGQSVFSLLVIPVSAAFS